MKINLNISYRLAQIAVKNSKRVIAIGDDEDSSIEYFPPLNTVPSVIVERLDKDEEVIALAKSDISGSKYGEETLILTNKRIFIVKDSNILNELNLREVELVEASRYVGSLVLKAKTNSGSRSLVSYTRTRAKDFEKIIMLINDLTLNKIPYEIVKKHLEEQAEENIKKNNRRKILIRMISFAKPFWHLMVATLSLTMLSTIIGLLPPYLMKILIDQVLIPRSNFELLGYIVLGLLGINLTLTLINVINGYLSLKFNQSLTYRIRRILFEKLQRLSLAFYDKYSTGGLISRMVDDVNRVQTFLTRSLGLIIIDITTIVFIGVILFSLSPWLSLIALIPVPVSYIGTTIYRKFSRRYYHRLWRKWSFVITVLTENITSNILVKTFGKEKDMFRKFTRSLMEFIGMNFSVFKFEQKFWPAIGFSFTVSTLLIWWIGGQQVLAGVLSLGSLTAFTSYMMMFYGPINRLINNLRLLQRAAISGERIFEILDADLEVKDKKNAKEFEFKGKVEYQNVWFTYDGIYYALRNVNLKVNPGEHIGIVGPSGSGKSTLIKLLLRLYEPQRGAIKIDGVKIDEIKLDAIKRQIAIVMQNPRLFSASIAENISLGKENVTLEEIITAAKAARAHDFIMKLPEAYDTHVGLNGSRLSGGERQRIAIAAAILKNPKILILDEPTSSLDAITEEEVTEAIDNLTKGRTTFIIAHRLSTLRNVDKIIVLDRGGIVEMGTHDELLEKGGLYKKLYESQFKGFLKQQKKMEKVVAK